MDIERTAEGAVLITVAQGQGSAMLARDTLARAFGLGQDEAAQVIAQGGAVVETGGQAESLVLLQLLGVQALQGAALFDLSIRLQDLTDSLALSVIAAECPGADLASLSGVSGLVIRDLAEAEARALAATLKRRPGIQVTLAPQASAVFDIFAPRGFVAPLELRRYLALLGHGAAAPVGTLGGALVSGLSAPLARRLVARFAHLGLFAVNQAFQRFDLHVTGPGRLDPWEAADFLFSRGHFEAGMAVQRGEEVLAERGLTRARVQQFLNDYNMIGLNTRLALSGLERQNG